MYQRLLLGALLASATLSLSSTTLGHGGTYRGPGDTVPPGGGRGGGDGGGAPVSPGPSGPSNPGGGGPGVPGVSPGPSPANGPVSNGPTTGGAVAVGPDLTLWDYWWGFNKEPYLNLRQKIRSGGTFTSSDDFFLGKGQADQATDTSRPTPQMIREEVVPALVRVLETERNNDLITGALIALAKIGEIKDVDGGATFRELFLPFLKNGEQEISETAALALGILADDDVTPILVSLMRDDPEGRKRIGGKEVPVRTRSFAAYGLGLVGHRTDSNELRREIAAELVGVLETGVQSRPDLQVGALAALGIVPLDWWVEEQGLAGNERIARDRASVLEYLTRRMNADTRGDGGFKNDIVRAHAPIAAARLLSSHEGEVPEDALGVRGGVVDGLLALVDANSKEKNVQVLQSATIALGMIGSSATGDGEIAEQNERIYDELRRIARDSAANQTEFFALVALAQMGSRAGSGDDPLGLCERVQSDLMSALARGKGQKKPWAAIAIGVFGNELRERNGALDSAVVSAVRDAARKGDRPREAGAYAIALGLLADGESEDLLLDRLEFFAQDETRGHIAVGLGLMQARGSAERLNEIIESSKFRPQLLKQAAVGVGLLGDKSAVDGLIGMLRTARGFAAQAAIANALGTIGDASSVAPLVEMLEDQGTTDSARGFAAVALGIVCDKEDYPWNTKLAVNVNYRAQVPTMTNLLGTGVLDIL